MSFYRTFIAAVAAMGLATAVFADDATTTTTTQGTDNTATTQTTGDNTAATTTTTTTTTADASTDKLDLNKATAKELMKIKGLNAARAKAIVSYRKKHGDFKSLDDLKEVSGFKKMNDKTMQEVQDQLTINS